MSDGPARHEVSIDGWAALRTRRIWYRPDLLVVAVSGDVDLRTLPELVVALEGEVPPVTVMDLSKVTFLSAAALGVLVQTASRIRSQNCELGLVAHDRVALRVLRMSGVAASIPTFESLSDAIRELASTAHDTAGQ